MKAAVNKRSRRVRLLRFLRWALVLEIAWLAVVNGLLWLPATQDTISTIRPEKFRARWDRAWTLAPFHFSVDGLFANGSARRQMWQVEAAAVSGWINPVPLLWKRVSLHGVAAADIDFRQRPRPRPDRDYGAIEAWFPEIEGRTVRPADESPYRSHRPWVIALHSIGVDGELRYWVYQLRGEARGRLHGNLEYRTRGGPFRLDVESLDLALGRHLLNGDRVVFEHGQARGSLGFAPIRPREDRGVALLSKLSLDLETEVDLDSLGFLNVFLLNIRGFAVDGSGTVVGRLRYDRGEVLPGTDLAVAARNLEMALMGHRIEGMGTVSLGMGAATGGQMALGFYYGDLRVRNAAGAELLTGQGLQLTVGGDGHVLPDPDRLNPSRVLELDLGRVDAPDLAAYQDYLPERWPFRLHGGRGELSGSVRIEPTAYAVDLHLDSDEADLGFGEYRFLADLDAGLKLANPSLGAGGAQADGSYLLLDDARLQRADDAVADAWSAGLKLSRGRLELVGSQRADEHDVVDLFQVLADTPLKDLLSDVDGTFDFRGAVSDLAWLGVFFGERYRTRVGGAAVLEGAARLVEGLPAPGTEVTVRSDGLLFNFLDWASRGRGEIHLAVAEEGDHDDWSVELELDDADLRRRGDGASFVEAVRIEAAARVEDLDLDARARQDDFELAFRMPEARVTDMSVFNRYLPPDAPLALTGGDARLAADLRFRPDDADGWVRLDGERIDLVVDGQDIRADLRAEIAVSGGRPADMRFDVTGSRIRLENVGVSGADSAFDDAGWSAELTLDRGETVFTEPLRLGVEARFQASDSRPLVTMFRNQDGWRPEFLARALTVEEITGQARLEMADRRLVIPFAWLTGGTLEAGAKAELSAAGNRGIVYLKYRDLDVVLRMAHGKRNLDVLRARRTFDAYDVGGE